MTVSAHDVARELRGRLRNAGDVKIHKLLYYCQGWHLARFGQPAFSEEIEAWANGPVVEALWRAEKYGRSVPDPRPLSEAVLETVEYVLSRYGKLNGKELIRLSHDERPWRVVSDRDDPWDDQTIGLPLLTEFFTTLDEVYSLHPFRMTPERKTIVDEAKARAGK